ncbi:protein phosphatase [Lyophyllum atratum]|nr:protein phosphatase [Lyophyllum atratum]
MDAIRVSKVEGVACTKSGTTRLGTIHLTAHHLIFRYDEEAEKEMWVPYPIISLVSCLPQTLQGQSPVNFHTRTFETFSLSFSKHTDANDVFESVKELTVATSVTQLYGFFYHPNPPLPTSNGWLIYSPRDEFGRMGVGSRSKAWRFTDINKDYSFCPTYPARLVVPTRISDTTLQYASKYRSKCRIPVLSYLHWANYGSITRSSQPMVGITQNRSIQDEKLIEAVFQTHTSPDARAMNAPVYGATTTNLIIDARPTANAMGNTVKGAGTENMDHYKEGKKVYLGIDHIHTMRESLGKVVETLREADTLLASINNDLPNQVPGLAVLDRGALRRSGWLRHISAILEGTIICTRNVHVNSSHVLIHCSDGWDRTSQLSALTQLCLDPFYRTIRGFEILIEKDWLSYGHKFLDRCGHLSSEKFFVSPTDAVNSSSGAEAFLASVQNRFISQHHIKETSPVFHQFLESVRQVQRQFPDRFEFNERFLHQLYYHLYSCQFGTFLFNCERERRVGDGGPPPWERTISIWDFMNSPPEMALNLNPTFDSSLNDPASRAPGADMGVLFPNPKDVRFWHELYGKTDEEMNGRPFAAQTRGPEVVGVVENADEDPSDASRADTPSSIPPPPSPSAKSAPLAQSMRSLNLRPDTARGVSPSPRTAPRELSSSPPSVSMRSNPSRADSTPLFASPSDMSLRPGRLPSPSPQTPARSRTKPPDFLPSSGVKSIWGKLSSNASAALSAVQDTYVNVAKDFIGSGEGESSARTAELRSRDTLSAWGEELPSSSTTSSTARGLHPLSPATANPWSSAASPRSQPSGLDENPWGSARSTHQSVPEPYQARSPLPLDPTVAHPLPRAASSLSTSSLKSTSSVIPVQNAVEHVSPPDASSAADPLGVGML